MPPSEPDQSSAQSSLYDRLRGLMIFRIAAVTLLLGGMLAVESAAPSDLSNTKNVALLGLIVLTYTLTIVYSLLLDRTESLPQLARFQLVGDVATTSLLVLFTNGLDSVFLFLFYVNIITAAIVLGRRLALFVASATACFILGLGVATSLEFTHPIFEFQGGPQLVRPIYFEVAVNCAAAFMIAFLAGDLSERLGETQIELERRELDLQTLRTLTQNIVASLNSGLLTIDRDGEIIFFNRAASAITGLDSDEVVGRPLDASLPEIADALDARVEPIEQKPDDGANVEDSGELSSPRFECRFERPDGETIFLGFSVSILCNARGVPFGHIVVFQDLTEVKKLEAEKQRSERMAAVGELAASIAHEIRNPLASISGSVEMLEKVADLDDNARNLMDIVLREVDRLDVLISEFLDYSRPSNLNREFSDLKAIVEDVLELFEEGNPSVEIELIAESDRDGEDWGAPLDQEAIRQILWNLLNNAIEASPGERTPRIRIELEHVRRDERAFYLLAVEDDGPGVDPEEEERIFEPFYTNRDEGSGLGLATTHRLVEAHGGRIQLDEPETLGGARFTLFFPESPSIEDGSDLTTTSLGERRHATESSSDSRHSSDSMRTETAP